MRAFYHPEQALHSPQQFMRYGRFVPVKDTPLRTERLIGALARHGIAPEEPAAYGTGPALTVHTPAFVRFLETAWENWAKLPDHGPEVWPQYFPYWSGRPEDAARPDCPATGFIGQVGWYLGDLSVPMGPDSWLSILRASETATAGADAILAGDRSAYALCRPSGHHARADRGTGFCYLNNSAIAAQRLRSRFSKVAIIDVDVHHGDGTQQIFYTRPDVLTISVHGDPTDFGPYYTGYANETGYGAGEGYNLNLPLQPGAGGAEMNAALDTAIARVRAFGADALVVALGFDAHRDDPIGILKLEAKDFGSVGTKMQSLGLPTLVVQEGGYGIDAIQDCLDAFLTGFKQT
jgi:acetoin utilization deacetylase AcuC-like enzyme